MAKKRPLSSGKYLSAKFGADYKSALTGKPGVPISERDHDIVNMYVYDAVFYFRRYNTDVFEALRALRASAQKWLLKKAIKPFQRLIDDVVIVAAGACDCACRQQEPNLAAAKGVVAGYIADAEHAGAADELPSAEEMVSSEAQWRITPLARALQRSRFRYQLASNSGADVRSRRRRSAPVGGWPRSVEMQRVWREQSSRASED